MIPADIVLAEDLKDAGVVEAVDLVVVGEKAIVIASMADTGSGNKESTVGLGGDRTSGVPFVDESVVLGQSVLDRNMVNRKSIDGLTSNILIHSVGDVLTADETVHLGCLHLLGSRGVGSVDGVHVIGSLVFWIVRLHVHGDRLGADLRRVGVRQVQGVTELAMSNALDLGRVIELPDHMVKRAILLNKDDNCLDLRKGNVISWIRREARKQGPTFSLMKLQSSWSWLDDP